MKSVARGLAIGALAMATTLGGVAVTAGAAAQTKNLAFKASYSGTIKILWGTSAASGSITGTGTGTTLGKGTITGNGTTTTFSTSSSSDPFTGTGTLRGPGGTINVKIVSATASSGASAAPTASAPDGVSVTGTAKVISGTGKFKGATGTLKVGGSFQVTTTTGTESDSFTATLSGTLKVAA